jgi:hypothetical protein
MAEPPAPTARRYASLGNASGHTPTKNIRSAESAPSSLIRAFSADFQGRHIPGALPKAWDE